MIPRTAIFIPARMAATRFPGKPLADINGKPMIVRVLERAALSGIRDIFIACSEQEVKEVVEAHGGQAIMTDPDLPSGTDRIYQALERSGGDFDIIVNVQGDLPTLDPAIITNAVDLLKKPDVEIGTLAAIIRKEEERINPNVVKAVIAQDGRALYFTRSTAPYGTGDLYHHIGLYTFRRKSLEKFVKLNPSPLEKREKLEQLRALENNMRIDVAIVDTVPLGVDTPEDLEKAILEF